jgi:predicted transcriptional regulator
VYVNALEIRQRITEEVKTRGLTPTTLAKMSGLERSNVSRYLVSNPKNISEAALTILDALNLELIVVPKEDGQPHA